MSVSYSGLQDASKWHNLKALRFCELFVNHLSLLMVNYRLEHILSLQFATIGDLFAKELPAKYCAEENVSLEDVLDLTRQLSEEILCAKIRGDRPLERQITTLVIVAIELRKAGVQWPTSLQYALDVPPPKDAGQMSQAVRLGKLKGRVDEITSNSVRGWAINEGSSNEPVELEIVVNGVPIAVVIANTFREDLEQAGIGTGRHAFDCSFENPISLLRNKIVKVRRCVDRLHLEE